MFPCSMAERKAKVRSPEGQWPHVIPLLLCNQRCLRTNWNPCYENLIISTDSPYTSSREENISYFCPMSKLFGDISWWDEVHGNAGKIKDANNSSKIHVFTEAGGNGFWLLLGQTFFSGGVGCVKYCKRKTALLKIYILAKYCLIRG